MSKITKPARAQAKTAQQVLKTARANLVEVAVAEQGGDARLLRGQRSGGARRAKRVVVGAVTRVEDLPQIAKDHLR